MEHSRFARQPLRVGGVVLCGGESRRMGESKAWLPFGDETLLARIVRVASTGVSPVVVATRHGVDLPPLPAGVEVVFDAEESRGPLAGIAAGFDALADCCDAILVVPCDHALLTRAFIERLIALIGDHSAVVPESDGHLFPTLAVYRMEARDVVHDLLASGAFRAGEMVARCRTRFLRPRDFADIDPNQLVLRNMNTPEEYQAILHMALP